MSDPRLRLSCRKTTGLTARTRPHSGTRQNRNEPAAAGAQNQNIDHRRRRRSHIHPFRPPGPTNLPQSLSPKRPRSRERCGLVPRGALCSVRSHLRIPRCAAGPMPRLRQRRVEHQVARSGKHDNCFKACRCTRHRATVHLFRHAVNLRAVDDQRVSVVLRCMSLLRCEREPRCAKFPPLRRGGRGGGALKLGNRVPLAKAFAPPSGPAGHLSLHWGEDASGAGASRSSPTSPPIFPMLSSASIKSRLSRAGRQSGSIPTAARQPASPHQTALPSQREPPDHYKQCRSRTSPSAQATPHQAPNKFAGPRHSYSG